MAIVGTAYVRVRVISDRLGNDIEKAVKRAVRDSDVDKIGRDAGRDIARGIADGIDKSPELNHAGENITEKITDDIDTPKSRRRLRTTIGNLFRKALSGLRAFSDFKLPNIEGGFVRALSGLFSGFAGAVTGVLGPLVKFGGILGGLTLLIGPLVSGLGGLIGAIGLLAGSLVLIPALGLAAVAAIGTLVIGFTNLKDATGSAADVVAVIQGFKDQWKQLQQSVQQNLFADLAEPIRLLGNTYLPILEQGLSGVASGFNSIFREAVNFLQLDVVQASTVKGLANVRTMLENVATGTGDWLAGWTMLADVGSEFLPRLGTFLASLGKKFSAFLQKLGPDGIRKIIDDSIEAFKSLGRSIKNVFTAFSGLFKAAGASGFSFLKTLERITGAISGAINSVKGQNGLKAFFDQVRGAVDTLVGALERNLGPLLGAIAPVLGTLATQVANVVGAALDTLTPILEQIGPKISGIFETLGPKITGIIDALAPVLVPLTDTLGILADTLGTALLTAAENLGPVLSDIATTFGDLVEALSPSFQSIVEAVSTAFADLWPSVKELVPKVEALVKAWTPVFNTIIATTASVFKFLAEKVLPPLLTALTNLGNWLADHPALVQGLTIGFFAWRGAILAARAALILLNGFMGIAGAAGLIGRFGLLAIAVAGVWALFNSDTVAPILDEAWVELNKWLDKVLGPWWGEFRSWMGQSTQVIHDWVVGAAEDIDTWLTKISVNIVNWGKQTWQDITGWLGTTTASIHDKVVNWASEFDTWMTKIAVNVKTWARQIWTDVTGWLGQTTQGIHDKVVEWAGAFDQWLTPIATKVANWAKGLWQSATGWLGQATADFHEWAADVSDFFFRVGFSIADSLIRGIKSQLPALNALLGSIAPGGSALAAIGNAAAGGPRPIIPRRAKGGIFDPIPGGHLSIIAEAGRAERVEPLDKNGLSKRDLAMISMLTGRSINGDGKGSGTLGRSSDNVNVQVFIGDQELTKIVDFRIAQANQLLTRSLLSGRRIATS